MVPWADGSALGALGGVLASLRGAQGDPRAPPLGTPDASFVAVAAVPCMVLMSAHGALGWGPRVLLGASGGPWGRLGVVPWAYGSALGAHGRVLAGVRALKVAKRRLHNLSCPDVT